MAETKPFAIGVTGTSKRLMAIQRVNILEALQFWRPLGEWMHNGLCVEADDFFAKTWRQIDGKIHGHPGNTPRMRCGFVPDVCEDPKPNLERNIDIVNASAALIAAPFENAEINRSGTWHTIRKARKCRRAITIIYPDGRVIRECGAWPG